MKTEVISENQKSINKKDAKILLKGLIQMTKDTFYQDHGKDDFDYEVEKGKMESYCEGLEDAIKKLDTLHTGYMEVTMDANKNWTPIRNGMPQIPEGKDRGEYARESSGRAEQAMQLLNGGTVGDGFLGEQIFACITDTSLPYDDRGLIKLYLNASEAERAAMDAVLTNLTGHDMDELLELAINDLAQGVEKDDPELD